MVAEAEIICQQGIPRLDVKYHLCVAQEHNVKVEVPPTSPSAPTWVSSESISTETSCFESVHFFSFYFLGFCACLRIETLIRNFIGLRIPYLSKELLFLMALIVIACGLDRCACFNRYVITEVSGFICGFVCQFSNPKRML